MLCKSVFRFLFSVACQGAGFFGVTGGGRSALTGGGHFVRLLGSAENFQL